jgi:transglutaminase-like putative cysteine protease
MRFSIVGLPDSDFGVYQFAALLSRIANQEKLFPVVRLTAAQIVAYTNPRNPEAQALALRDWIASHVRFLRDPAGAELVQTPEYLLTELSKFGTVQGDCDDVATLAAALAMSIGLRARFQLVGFDGPTGPYGHIWTEVQGSQGGPWWEIDTTRPDQGFDFSRINRVRTIPL